MPGLNTSSLDSRLKLAPLLHSTGTEREEIEHLITGGNGLGRYSTFYLFSKFFPSRNISDGQRAHSRALSTCFCKIVQSSPVRPRLIWAFQQQYDSRMLLLSAQEFRADHGRILAGDKEPTTITCRVKRKCGWPEWSLLTTWSSWIKRTRSLAYIHSWLLSLWKRAAVLTDR